jgi:hypothetical protein
MGMFASCCTTSPVHHLFSYRSHLLFKMSHTTENKEFWQEFVQLYRFLTELWKVKSYMYKNHNLKDIGCDELVEKLLEIEEDADRDMVRKKINGLRTAYSFRKLIISCLDTVSCCTTHFCTTRCCANLFDHIWGPVSSVVKGYRAVDVFIRSSWFPGIQFL